MQDALQNYVQRGAQLPDVGQSPPGIDQRHMKMLSPGFQLLVESCLATAPGLADEAFDAVPVHRPTETGFGCAHKHLNRVGTRFGIDAPADA